MSRHITAIAVLSALALATMTAPTTAHAPSGATTPATDPTPTVTFPVNPIDWGVTPTIDVSVSPVPSGGVPGVRLTVDGAAFLGLYYYLDVNGTVSISYPEGQHGKLGIGDHTIVATYWPTTDGPAGASSAPATLTVQKAPSDFTFQMSEEDLVPGGEVQLYAWLGTGSGGSLAFHEVVGGVDTVFYDQLPGNVSTPTGYQYGASTPWESATTGTFDFYVVYHDSPLYLDSTSATTEIHVVAEDATLTLGVDPAVPNAGDAVTLQATLGAGGGAQTYDPSTATGTIIFSDTFGGAHTLGTGEVNDGVASIDLATLPQGTHKITASYSGDDRFAAESTPVTSLIVGPDIVEVSGLSVSPSTFYPKVDGYRDLLTVAGTLAESAHVTVSIKTTGGTLVKGYDLGIELGDYAVEWDGKRSNGSMAAAGQYDVVQTLVDGAGTHKTSTTRITLSLKGLVYKSVTVVRSARDMDAKGKGGTGSVKNSPTSSTGIRLAAGSGWAGAGWQFTLPKAVAYKSVSFAIKGASGIGVLFGIQNWTVGDSWDVSNFDDMVNPGGPTGWHTTTGTPGEHISASRMVRGLAYVGSGATYDVQSVRLTYSYGILK